MTITVITPQSIHPPGGAYSHGMVTTGPGQVLYISGQLGIDAEGNTPVDFSAQADLCFRNILAVLKEAGMTPHNLVKLTNYVTQVENTPELGKIRALHMNDARPASTVIGVSALARPEWLVEIEAIAFRPD